MHKTLLQELLATKNLYTTDQDTYALYRLYLSYFYFMIISILIFSFILIIINLFFPLNSYFKFNDYTSFIIGLSALFYSFKMIKQKNIPHYSSNPLMVIGIIYPFFFNVSFFYFIDDIFLNTHITGLVWGIFLIIINYFLLNAYYRKVNQL